MVDTVSQKYNGWPISATAVPFPSAPPVSVKIRRGGSVVRHTGRRAYGRGTVTRLLYE